MEWWFLHTFNLIMWFTRTGRQIKRKVLAYVLQVMSKRQKGTKMAFLVFNMGLAFWILGIKLRHARRLL